MQTLRNRLSLGGLTIRQGLRQLITILCVSFLMALSVTAQATRAAGDRGGAKPEPQQSAILVTCYVGSSDAEFKDIELARCDQLIAWAKKERARYFKYIELTGKPKPRPFITLYAPSSGTDQTSYTQGVVLYYSGDAANVWHNLPRRAKPRFVRRKLGLTRRKK